MTAAAHLEHPTPATLTVVAQNVKKKNPHGWPILIKRIRSVDPDIVCLSELPSDPGTLQMFAEGLGMASPGLAPAVSGTHTALLYKPDTMGAHVAWETNHSHLTQHGLGIAFFKIGLPYQLAVASVHLNPYAIGWALCEASLAAARARRQGPLAIIAGDINYSPGYGPDPDFSAMGDWNINQRTVMTDPARNEPLVPDRRVAWTLERSGFCDVAAELHRGTRDDALLVRTGRHERVDQIWVSRPLAEVACGYRVIDHREDGASDHQGVVAAINLKEFESALHISQRDRAGHF